MPPKKKVERAATENISLGPQVREGWSASNGALSKSQYSTYLLIGELVFGVARIFASFNDTFVHVTDLRFVRNNVDGLDCSRRSLQRLMSG